MSDVERAIPAVYRVRSFSDAGDVSADDVLDFWRREQAVDPAVAKRRVNQVLLVAEHPDDGIVGVATTYLVPNQQLAVDLWHFRVYVALPHRTSNVAYALFKDTWNQLEQRFVAGDDTRGVGVAYVVENEGLEQRYTEAVWMDGPEVVATFIGEGPRGLRVSVRYFRGALAPPPPT